MTFPEKAYASLEDPDVRGEALEDPRSFLARFPDGAVLDEAQRVPDLFSYLQTLVDEDRRTGLWVLTGSEHFLLLRGISQSLAGRVAVLHLLPLGWDELQRFPSPPGTLFEALYAGSYPRIHDQRLRPAEWFQGYVEAYVERDVRRIQNIGDLEAFRTFLRLAAGRSAQLLNLSSLAADCGLSHPTIRSWLSVLDTSFLTFRTRPLLDNLHKRMIRTPKLHFTDSGLSCYLLGLREPEQVRTHPLRGALFETWVAAEIVKWRMHRALPSDLHFYRDRQGLKVDLVLQEGNTTFAIEVKSGRTFSMDALAPLERFRRLLLESPRPPRTAQTVLIYGGDDSRTVSGTRVLSWRDVAEFSWVGE